MRFTAAEADNIELAARRAGTPVLAWLHQLIHETAADEAEDYLQGKEDT